MGQKEVENENYCGVFEMRDLARFFSEVLNVHVAIGNMWTVLWDKLEENKLDLHLVHPLKTKAIASNKLKNGKLDANILAKIVKR